MYRHSELERVVCAGALSESFRRQLLDDPKTALKAGYMGQSFHLSKEEMAFVSALKVRDFQEFASRVSNWLYGNNGTRVYQPVPANAM